jgi:hypothetical protein
VFGSLEKGGGSGSESSSAMSRRLVAARLTSGCVKGWLGSKKAYGGRKRGLEVGLEVGLEG